MSANKKNNKQGRLITEVSIRRYEQALKESEHAAATIEKYSTAIREFMNYLNGQLINKENLLEFRNHLKENHAAQTVNGTISAINKYLELNGMPGLKLKLLQYAEENGILSGKIFLTRSGKPLLRSQIWAEMKSICEEAGVEASKVFPHNLRHLFARCYYRLTHDVVKLADLLGHSSIETTRIYLKSSMEEQIRTLARMGLVT